LLSKRLQDVSCIVCFGRSIYYPAVVFSALFRPHANHKTCTEEKYAKVSLASFNYNGARPFCTTQQRHHFFFPKNKEKLGPNKILHTQGLEKMASQSAGCERELAPLTDPAIKSKNLDKNAFTVQ